MTPIIRHIYGPISGITHTGSGDIIINGSKYQMSSHRSFLFETVNRYWIEGILEPSLHGAALINLEWEALPNAVAPRTEGRAHNIAAGKVATNQPLKHLLNKSVHSLLVLGEAGAGKTTALLELALDTWEAAKSDHSQPVPIHLNLSSWNGEALEDWVIDRMSRDYNVRSNIIRQWLEQEAANGIENNQLLLLLDGLDELKTLPQRKGCARAINQFCEKGYGRYLVIACREQIYADLHPLKLNLDGCIRLKPLTLTQIDAFLTTVAPSLEKMREHLQQYKLLWELAQKPLMLSVMVTVYQSGNAPGIDRFNSLDTLREFLFAQYVHRMFRRTARTDHKPFAEADTRKMLSWLAQNLPQSIFLLEDLQPSWLTTQRQQKQYTLISRIVTAVILGFLFGDPISGLFTGLLGGTIVGLIINRRFQRQATDLSPASPRRSFLTMALIGGLIAGPIGGVMMGLMIGSILIPFGADAVRYGTTVALLFGTALFIIRGLIYGLIFGSTGRGERLHNDIQRREELIWSWSKAKEGLLRGLGTGLTISALVGIGFSAAVYFLNGLASAVIFGIGIFLTAELIYGLLFGLMSGWRGEPREIGKVTFPGAGLQNVFKNALLIGTAVTIISGLLLGIITALLILIIVGLFMQQWPVAIIGAMIGGASSAITLGPAMGGLALLWYGGVDFIQHHTVRLLLRHSKTIPALRMAEALDYATERILLRKVGGGYIFIHRQLQEYFAKFEQE